MANTNLTPTYTKDLLLLIFLDVPIIRRIPSELQNEIASHVTGDWTTKTTKKSMRRLLLIHSAVAPTPPRSGTASIMRLPAEIRRQIFSESLPARDVIHHPICKDELERRVKRGPNAGPRRNRVSDFMTLNKKISGEVAEMVYEERFFVIHVHEGLRDGGIEFLNAGRQLLQYQDSIEDPRFHKFGKDDKYGFCRLKKIIVQIYSASEESSRHTVVNTYFANLALCRLLERARGGITSLKIEFPKQKRAENVVGRGALQHAEQYWWDAEKHAPRATSFHSISNIELVLRPFATLTGCHSVSIELPEKVRNHDPTTTFVSKLKEAMTNEDKPLEENEQLMRNIETTRPAMEDYVNYTLHGKGHHVISKLTEAEMVEDVSRFEEETSDDEVRDGSNDRKRGLSPDSQETGGDWKRRSWQTREDWADEQRLMLESHQSAQEEEDRCMAEALAASMRETSASQAETEEWQAPENTNSFESSLATNIDTYASHMPAEPIPQVAMSEQSRFEGTGCTTAPTPSETGEMMGEVVENSPTPASLPNRTTKSLPIRTRRSARLALNNLSSHPSENEPARGNFSSPSSLSPSARTFASAAIAAAETVSLTGDSDDEDHANNLTPSKSVRRSLRSADRQSSFDRVDLTGDADREDNAQASTLSSPMRRHLRLSDREPFDMELTFKKM